MARKKMVDSLGLKSIYGKKTLGNHTRYVSTIPENGRDLSSPP